MIQHQKMNRENCRGANAEIVHRTDAELVLAARHGDKRAFVEIVARHQSMVCGTALGILGDFAASEDAAQETFLSAWRKIRELREPARLRTWLFQIARNAALAQLRRRREHDDLESALVLAADSPNPDENAASEEEAALVRDALSKVPELYRVPLVLYYREGESVRAVAQELELSEDAVKQRLARGREMLREQVVGVIERVLTRTNPGPVFTMTIAAAIGALTAPTAVASGAFAGVGSVVSSASSTPVSTSILATMSASKPFLATATAIALLSIPVGYHFGGTHRANTVGPSVMPRPPESLTGRGNKFESALFAEWRELHDKHGTNAAAMPALYKAIGEIADPFRRDALHTALVAEWVEVDPAAGLRFFFEHGRSSRQRRQFFQEWLALDARVAVDALLAQEGWESLGREYLVEIARRAPERVAGIVSRVPKGESFHFNREVNEAFAVLAETDLERARATAETITGPNRSEALAGVARVDAKRDFDAAIAWARKFPEGLERDEMIRSALIGQAAIDPVAALDQLDLVGPGGRQLVASSRTAAQVLAEAGKANYDAAVKWLVAHPGRVSRDDIHGLNGPVTERLNADAAGFLTTSFNEGSLETIMPAVESALINLATGQWQTVWEWTKSQPKTDLTERLRIRVLTAAAHSDPDLALKLAQDIPHGAEGDSELQRLAGGLFPGGYLLHRFDTLVEQAPDRLRPVLVKTAFQSLGLKVDDPHAWIQRLDLLPKESRAEGIAGIAHAWTMRYPEEAVAWADTLRPGEERNAAVAAIAKSWARHDAHAAAEWVSQMPSSAERDDGAQSLVLEVADERPTEAWNWALSIADPAKQKAAAAHAAKAMWLRDPATAEHWIDRGPFAPEIRAELRLMLDPAGAAVMKERGK
jgi:RNA polymerase sigma factor (sigma-70 family)